MILFIGFTLLTGCSSKGHLTGELHFDQSAVKHYTFDLENLKHLPAPYVARFEKGRKTLLYLASEHVSAEKYPDLLQHPTFKTIKKLFIDFRPQVVIVEGLDTGNELSPRSIIEYADKCITTTYISGCGESFYAINQARHNKADYVTGEPAETKLIKDWTALGQKPEDLLGFYLVRQIPQFKRQGSFDPLGFPQRADQFLQRYQKKMGIQVKYGFEEFVQWYQQHMSKPKSYLDIENNDPAPHGGPDATYVQRISHEVSFFRDQNVLETIERMLNLYDRVLIIYGGSHLITQEPALEQELGKAEYFKLF